MSFWLFFLRLKIALIYANQRFFIIVLHESQREINILITD
jgi:hypothetical protein